MPAIEENQQVIAKLAMSEMFEEDIKDEDQEKTTEEKKEEKSNNEDELILQRKNPTVKPDKQKPDKDSSIAVIRQQRDDLQKKFDEFKTSIGTNLDPVVFKPLIEFIVESSDGIVNSESIIEFINDNKKKGETIKEMQERLESNELKVKDLDIRYSDEFKQDYEIPLKESAENLFLTFAQITEDKQIIAPQSSKLFQEFLIKNADTLTGIEVKAALSKFIKNYKEESGEEPSVPTVNNLMESLRDFKSKKHSRENAFSNWSEEKKTKESKKILQEQEENQAAEKKYKRFRTEQTSKAFQDFDLDSHDFIQESELRDIFKEEYDLSEKMLRGEDIPPYSELLTRGAESRLWRKYAPKIKELLELEKKVKSGERNGIRGSDFTGNIIKDDGDPEGFMKMK